MAVLFITHDLGVVAETAQSVVVMYAAQVVEQAPVGALFRAPRHPYTAGLLEAMPQIALQRGHDPVAIPGAVAQAHSWPAGCRFNPRCGHRREGPCTTAPVALRQIGDAVTRCIRAEEIGGALLLQATGREMQQA